MIFAFIACHLASVQETARLGKLDSVYFTTNAKRKRIIILSMIMLDFVHTQA